MTSAKRRSHVIASPRASVEKEEKWTADLEEKERNLRLENKVLQAHKAALTNELLSLKNRALDHKDCKCDPVREYLMISARRGLKR